jgi:hypothetical protein
MNIGLARLHETTIGNNALMCTVPQIEICELPDTGHNANTAQHNTLHVVARDGQTLK